MLQSIVFNGMLSEADMDGKGKKRIRGSADEDVRPMSHFPCDLSTNDFAETDKFQC